jgi:hypothetical protein
MHSRKKPGPHGEAWLRGDELIDLAKVNLFR